MDPVLAVFILDAVLDKFLQNYALPYLDPALELNEKKGLEEKIDSIVTMLRQGFAAADGI
jgi:hypothetical protein